MEKRLLSAIDLAKKFEVTRGAIYKWEKTRPEFPKRIKYGPRSGGWVREEIDVYFAKCEAQRKGG